MARMVTSLDTRPPLIAAEQTMGTTCSSTQRLVLGGMGAYYLPLLIHTNQPGTYLLGSTYRYTYLPSLSACLPRTGTGQALCLPVFAYLTKSVRQRPGLFFGRDNG